MWALICLSLRSGWSELRSGNWQSIENFAEIPLEALHLTQSEASLKAPRSRYLKKRYWYIKTLHSCNTWLARTLGFLILLVSVVKLQVLLARMIRAREKHNWLTQHYDKARNEQRRAEGARQETRVHTSSANCCQAEDSRTQEMMHLWFVVHLKKHKLMIGDYEVARRIAAEVLCF
jgi:hypothetical protein